MGVKLHIISFSLSHAKIYRLLYFISFPSFPPRKTHTCKQDVEWRTDCSTIEGSKKRSPSKKGGLVADYDGNISGHSHVINRHQLKAWMSYMLLTCADYVVTLRKYKEGL